MTRLFAFLLALVLCAAESRAQQPADCPVPNYLLFGDSALDRVNKAVVEKKTLKIVVVGTASSTLPGRDGAASARKCAKRRTTRLTLSIGYIHSLSQRGIRKAARGKCHVITTASANTR